MPVPPRARPQGLVTVRGNRHGSKDRRHAKRPTTHKGAGPWVKGYDHRLDGTCGATTIREPDDPRWSPELPDTYVSATCAQPRQHKGWHVAVDGYAWDPEDDSHYVHLPTTT